MSYDTRNVWQACLRHGRALALVLAAAAVGACSGDGDGSVGIGTGQDPDPVAPDFPIAYTKGPINDEDDELQVNTDLRDILRFAVGSRAQRHSAFHRGARRCHGRRNLE